MNTRGANRMGMEMKLCASSRRRVESCYGSFIKASCMKGEEESNKENEDKVIGFFELFRYATLRERCALWSGVLFCGIMSMGIPVSSIIYGEFTTLLVERTCNVTSTSTPTLVLGCFGGGRVLTNPSSGERYDALLEDSQAFAVSSIVTAVFQMIFGVVGVDLLNYAALNQIGRVRRLLLESMLRQDMSWYDTKQGTNFATKMSEDVEKMKEGMGEKIGIFVYLIVSFVLSVIVAFIYGWKLTLVVLSSAPVIVMATAVVAKVQSSLSVKELKAYGCAGVVAEEVLESIRTVVAFGGENIERERYTKELQPAKEVGSKKGLYSGLGAGVMWLIVYISYAIAFYYGITLIVYDRHLEEKEYTPAVLIIVFFGVLAGAQNLGLTAPHIDSFNSARAAAHGVFAIIERKSEIDSLSPEGAELDNPREDIAFSDIYFHYPSRPDVKILQGLNLEIKAGETMALVGSSGCGKSTCIQLLQRLYDPPQGKVTIAGRDIREYSVSSLRGAIGLVGQEPVLFATSIRDNIRYGEPDCTQAEIEEAARNANCHAFIKKLPAGYDTIVGERGAQLSGGQKQRIAIARALVRRPAILLLDEATSALDSRSQAKVQKALDKACLGRTTIIVSHRLSTIVNADKIVVIEGGQAVEVGTHSELMEQQGAYYNLVNTDVPPTHPKTSQGIKLSRSRGLRRSLVDSLPGVSDASFDKSSSSSSDGSVETLLEKPKIKPKKPSFMRMLKLNSPEWLYITVGCIASLVNGATLPVFAIVFGGIYGVLSLEDGEEVIRRTMGYCFWFLGIGIVTGGCTFAQIYMFSISGARLTARLRSAAFSAMLRQEMGWFDNDKNSVGALGSRLAGDCSAIQGATGTRIGSMLNSFSTMVLGFALAFYFSWKLTLVSASVLPMVLGAVFLEARFSAGVSTGEKAAIEASSRIATEAIANIKTVASLCQERAVQERYDLEMAKVSKSAQKKVRMRGFVFSLGQTAPFLGYAVSLSYGGLMVANREIPYEDVIIVSEALIFGSWMLGQALAYAPNVNMAVLSAKDLFALLDREPLITSSPDAKPLKGWKAEGDIVYDLVEFCYPNRPDTAVLQGLALTVGRGRSVALVGPSGCGKSTCIQLLQRLYDPIIGDIYLDSKNIVSDIPLKELRSQIGLVGQEPVLFDRTIEANIRYGDNSREVSMQEVIEAATSANIHGFIIALPLGYTTRLGPKGAQLSGGQKQRIAIARALIRDPRVLLLDEATSALDAQSEKLVQEALDKARVGRTCITIAHRLNTIRNADLICVLDNGSVAEAGSHEELMDRGGIYRKLYLAEQAHQR